ncbi:RNA polymerase II transcription factor B 52 kDa subunit [Batrachochytrium dendrobatidis]|nr:RNA polymerase II transcription factor B 52 kDa subunit [Batrachochytrium dendrobatidis]
MMLAEASSPISGNVGQYLESLPRPVLDRLFAQPATCLAILRLLPDLAKHTILRLLYTSMTVKISDIETWETHEYSGQFSHAVTGLAKLHILSIKNEGSHKSVHINSVFQKSIHNALVGSGSHTSFGMPCETIDKHRPSIAFLETYAKECWESVLHYLVGTPSDKRPKAIVKLLEKSGLMAPISSTNAAHNGDLRITSKGFQFLLQDVNVQIWAFLLQYLEMAEQLNMELVEVLNFFFQLGSLELGQDYSVEVLTPTQKHMLDDLKHLGLIYQRKKKSTRFYPTHLATSLTSGASAGAVLSPRSLEADSDGFIIIETNYRVYAYTDSPLQIAVLSLFIEMRVRFANMVIGIITRDSVREALAKGISAEQIIAYLTTHAHPEMKKGSPVLPTTIVDQVRLWEMERNRLRISRGHLYQMFSGEQEYREILKYATDLGYELWHSDSKRLVVVSAEGHEHIKVFFSKQRNKQLGAAK